MKFDLEKEMGMLSVNADDVGLPSYAEVILDANKIDSLVPFMVRSKNNTRQYCYDIGGRTSLERYYSRRALPLEELERIVDSLAALPDILDEHLLEANWIDLSPEMIFYNESRQKYEYCLSNADQKSYCEGIRELMAFLLRKVDHSDEDCVRCAYALFDLVGNDGYRVEEMKSVFESQDFEYKIDIPFDEVREPCVPELREAAAEDEFPPRLSSGGKRIIAEYEVEDSPAQDRIHDERACPGRGLKRFAAIVLPLLGVAAFACLFALGYMNSLPLWLKIVCPALVIASLVLLASAVWPRPEVKKTIGDSFAAA